VAALTYVRVECSSAWGRFDNYANKNAVLSLIRPFIFDKREKETERLLLAHPTRFTDQRADGLTRFNFTNFAIVKKKKGLHVNCKISWTDFKITFFFKAQTVEKSVGNRFLVT